MSLSNEKEISRRPIESFERFKERVTGFETLSPSGQNTLRQTYYCAYIDALKLMLTDLNRLNLFYRRTAIMKMLEAIADEDPEIHSGKI